MTAAVINSAFPDYLEEAHCVLPLYQEPAFSVGTFFKGHENTEC